MDMRGMIRRRAVIAFALGVAVLGIGGCTGSSGAGKTPEEVVGLYLTAMKSGDYPTAYDLLTPHMVREQGKIAWVAEQAAIMRVADVTISSFEVFPAQMNGDEAIVPNL